MIQGVRQGQVECVHTPKSASVCVCVGCVGVPNSVQSVTACACVQLNILRVHVFVCVCVCVCACVPPVFINLGLLYGQVKVPRLPPSLFSHSTTLLFCSVNR